MKNLSASLTVKEALEILKSELGAEVVEINMRNNKFVDKIIADKTSENVQERTYRCSFNMKSLKFSNTETYYLVIADENGMPAQREEFQIDIVFAVDEFNFFG